MLRLLTRQFVREWLSLSALACFLVAFALLGLQTTRVLPLFLGAGLGLSTTLSLVVNLLPAILQTALPIALFIGITATFARLARDGEWTALLAIGVSRRQLFLPVFFVGALISLFCLWLQHFQTPHDLAQTQQLLQTQGMKAAGAAVQPGYFTEINENLLVFVHEKQADGWQGAFVLHDADDGQQILWAQRAILSGSGETSRLTLENGAWQRERPQLVQSRFATLDMPLHTIAKQTAHANPIAPKWQMATSPALRAMEKTCGADESCRRMAGELARRTSMGLSGLLFSLIGLLMAGGRLLQRPATAYVVAAGLVLGWYLVERFGLTLSEKALLPAQLGAFLPLVAALTLMAAMLIRERR